ADRLAARGAFVVHEGMVLGRMRLLSTREAATLLLTLDGYHDKSITIPSRPNLAVLGNIVFGWARPAVDASTEDLEQRRTDPLCVWLVHTEQDRVTRKPID